MNLDFKKLLPHAIAVGIFILISVIYCSPVLQGKKISQSDISRFKGMSKEIVDFRAKYGDEPLWTNSMFSGMPAYQISTEYPANLTRIAKKVSMFFMGHPIGTIFLLMIGFYLLIIALKIDYRLGIAGAIAFGLSSYFLIILEAGHNTKVFALAYIPLIVAGILVAYKRNALWGAAIAAMGLALQLNANHLQITYYTMLLVAVLGCVYLVYAIREKTIGNFTKASAYLLVAVVLAVLPNITRLLVTYEYGKETMRGKSELESAQESSGLDKEYAFRWSYGISETMTILIPNYMGGASASNIGENSELFAAFSKRGVPVSQAVQLSKNAPSYWGKQPITSGPTYYGAGIIFLFILGLQLVKGPDKWWILIVTVLMTMLSWGHNFQLLTDIFFNYFPAYNKFRAVSMMLSIPAFTVPLLAILALDRIFREKLSFKQIEKPLYISAGITGGLCLIFALMPSLAGNFSGASDGQLKELGWPVDALIADRKSMLTRDAFRSLFFVLATAGLLWAYLKNKVKLSYAMIGLSVLFLIDLWSVDKRYLNNDDFVEESKVAVPFPATSADRQILNDPDPHFRVFNVSLDPFADASTSYYHKSIGGYHGAKLKRYQELIDAHIGKNNIAVLSMLNTKYFIVNAREGGDPVPQLNPQRMGNSWFVKEIQLVENADEEIAALTEFDPAVTAFADRRFESMIETQVAIDSTAVIKLKSYKANDLVYESNSQTEQIAVFSEIYYDKGWNAYIDGVKTDHFRVNYVLRAMMVPAGAHEIEFKFEPTSYYTGEKIAMAGSLLLYAGFGFVLFLQIRNIKQEIKPVEEKKVAKKPTPKRK